MNKPIVRPESLVGTHLTVGEHSFEVVDLSLLRVVVVLRPDVWSTVAPQGRAQLGIGSDRVEIEVALEKESEHWARFRIEKIMASGRAKLRSFLSPKRIGESLLEDWSEDGLKHFHGLNETDLWIKNSQVVLFSELEPDESDKQFLIRVVRDEVQLGWMLRSVYLEMTSIEATHSFLNLGDKRAIVRLCECRDIVTNFRPRSQTEFQVKQMLIKTINEHLFFAGRRAEMALRKQFL